MLSLMVAVAFVVAMVAMCCGKFKPSPEPCECYAEFGVTGEWSV